MTTLSSPTAGEVAARLRGKPALIGNHVLQHCVTRPQWRIADDPNADLSVSNLLGWETGTDVTDDTYYPVHAAYNRACGEVTRPTDAVLTAQHCAFVFEIPTSGVPLNLLTFDKSLIIGSNFGEFGSALTVSLEIAHDNSDSTYSTDILHGWQWVMTGDNADGRRLYGDDVRRIGSMIAPAPGRFTNARFGRLLLELSSGTFDDTIPHFEQLWLGRTRQLSYMPDRPYDGSQGHTESRTHVSESGIVTRYDQFTRQAIHEMTLSSDGPDLAGLDQNEELRQWWWNDSEGGKPSLLIINESDGETVTSDPYMVQAPTDFRLPNVDGYALHSGTFEFKECAPFYRNEVAI